MHASCEGGLAPASHLAQAYEAASVRKALQTKAFQPSGATAATTRRARPHVRFRPAVTHRAANPAALDAGSAAS